MAEVGRLVVVGAGLAGLRTVEGLRSRGYDGEVILVGDEPDAPYDRPPLSKQYLAQGDQIPYLRPPDGYADLGVDLRLGVGARAVDTDAKVIHLEDGRDVGYDTAVLATGASARHLPRVTSPHLHVLRTAYDAQRLRTAILATGELVVVGAGFLGCEAAATAVGLGAKVTLIETQPQPLARVLGAEIGAEVAAIHRAQGVDLRTGQALTNFEHDDRVTTLSFEDGSVASGAVVLVSIGASPATEWLAGSGIKVDDGILCDEFGRTTADGVWAVGDAASWWSPTGTAHRRYEHWTHASDQADLVAANILSDDPQSFAQVPYFWSDQFGTKIQALGDPHPDDLAGTVRVGDDQRLLAVYAKDNRVTAVVGFGLPRPVMRARSVVQNGGDAEELLASLRA